MCHFEITAYKNTWIHARRKKREHLHQNKTINSPETSKKEPDFVERKRHIESSAECSSEKKVKSEPFLVFSLSVKDVIGKFQMVMQLTDRIGNNELLHQLGQFFKNNM